ncbi:hypothetical protein EJB05_47152 [Eragrostis curvula]|uniref:Disease resistance protein At4g27190-like leucine-rich repeats domain-containing protein n=1 Tax=Eragrostis curvula TaxID=38414 RepID=A0A5J9T961_9POAL|nr:hypothetical protein EJB05_47152 [Eragrostis curvula]
MPLEVFAVNIEEAARKIIPFLEDTSNTAHNAICFDGYIGLGASAVLRAIAEEPPPSLREKFSNILHIDCLRWKSRRAMQRTIAEQLKLPPQVMDVLKRRDEEDDFSGVDEASRTEVADVTWAIFQTIRSLSCLVIFHNGSDNMVDFRDFGFPQFDRFSPNTLLWTFRGRLRLNEEIIGKVDSSHLFLGISWYTSLINNYLKGEAREIVQHTQYKEIITTETAAECLMYLLWLNTEGHGIMNCNLETQASNYWVCDGIIQERQFDKPWEISAAIHQELRTDFSKKMELRTEDVFHELFKSARAQHWRSVTYTSDSIEKTEISPEITSYFLAAKNMSYAPLPINMCKKFERLRVLKLSGCSFSFYSPPFRCCRGLRFLGLDHCKDQQQEEEEEERKQGRPAMEFFQSLWVLDINQTDWEVDFSHDGVEILAENIRDIHIRKGRIWENNLAWRQLQNIRKLRVINPTSSWETGNKDEFKEMVKLELLDLSGNVTIQALPSLSGATGLKILILDGCVGLENVGPKELPPSLESFSFDARSISVDSPVKLSKISLAGCVNLKSILLSGAFPALEELNLSGTSIKKLDLRLIVGVLRIKKIFLMGCKQLHAILWWTKGRPPEVLRIDTLGTNEDTDPPYSVSSSPPSIRHKNYDAYVVAGDARSSNWVIAKPCCYNDVLLEGMAAYDDEISWPPPSDHHVDVGEGISLNDAESDRANIAIATLIHRHTHSLHVHDNSSMINIMPKMPTKSISVWSFVLQWCRVERCPKLQAVFAVNNWQYVHGFHKLEKIWASDLLMAHCIWSKRIFFNRDSTFEALRRIHVHNCPRLKFVLPFKSEITLPQLEALHITRCGDLTQVFPWDDYVSEEYSKGAVKEFPKLKQIHLFDLPNLQAICAAKMYTPMLESVRLRGCWGLRRLPVVGCRDSSHRPVVYCEKDCWEKLKWDGLHVGHDPTLYQQHYSSVYYKKRLLRGTMATYVAAFRCCRRCRMDQGFDSKVVVFARFDISQE